MVRPSERASHKPTITSTRLLSALRSKGEVAGAARTSKASKARPTMCDKGGRPAMVALNSRLPTR